MAYLYYQAHLTRQLLPASLNTYTPSTVTSLVELDGVLVGGGSGLLAALLDGEVLGGVGGAAVGAGEGRDAGDGGLVSVYPNSTRCPRTCSARGQESREMCFSQS